MICFEKSLSILTLVLLLCVMTLPILSRAASSPTTYYISAAGNDRNNGVSAATPWRTFTNVQKLQLKAGERVLLRRGDTWNERLTVHAAGTGSAWVYIGPYGKLSDPAPVISLGSERDDICIVAQDLYYDGSAAVNNGLNYLHIDNITLKNSRIGIYFRYLVSQQNQGVKVTNCEFVNMVCDEVMRSIEQTDNIARELAMVKGNLDNMQGGRYSAGGGGSAEYI